MKAHSRFLQQIRNRFSALNYLTCQCLCNTWCVINIGLTDNFQIFSPYRIEEHDDHAPPFDENEDSFKNDPNLMHRRNSRSLPTTPSSSPKTMRKFQPQPNPYFTITGSEAPPVKQ